MKRSTMVVGALLVASAGFALGAETRKSLVATYDTIADSILAAKKSERNVVTAILETHRGGARRAFNDGNWEEAAAQMALFANEGDNAVGGIRTRLLEGGHHHNAEGEAKGIYDDGYVVVTKACKRACLAASHALQTASDDAGRKAAWTAFEKASGEFVKGE
ncbi:MAG: hypothetical protein HMLKMBBP_00488 [Planctomycetes bacterium]|nr:hypothetical protein [Planctomycetota bacterium]